MAWKRAEQSQNAKIPTIRGDHPCFMFLTKGCVCTGHYAGGPCRHKHLDLLASADNSGLVKADFQNVLDFLKKSSIRPILQLSPEAEVYLAKFA
jgi:hypothetical protein